MPRLAVSAEQKRRRRYDEQRARRAQREEELRQMMDDDEDPHKRIVQPPDPADLASQLPRQAVPRLWDASITAPTSGEPPPRPQPQTEPLSRTSYTEGEGQSAPAIEHAGAARTMATQETSTAARVHRTNKHPHHLQRVLERVKNVEQVRAQQRRAREHNQHAGALRSQTITEKAKDTSHEQPQFRQTNPGRNSILVVEIPASRSIANPAARPDPRIEPLKTRDSGGTAREPTVVTVNRSAPARAVSISSTSYKATTSDTDPSSLPPPLEWRVSRTTPTWSSTDRQSETGVDSLVEDTVHVADSLSPSPSLGYARSSIDFLAEPRHRRDEPPGARRGGTISPSDVHRANRVRESSIPEIATLNLSDDLLSRHTTAEEAGQDGVSHIEKDIEAGSDYLPSSPISMLGGVSASVSAFGPDSRPVSPTTPISSGQPQEDSPSELTVSHLSLLSSPGWSSASTSPRLADHATPTATRRQPSSTHQTVLNRYIRAIAEQETRGGSDFLAKQGKMYQQVLKAFFDIECDCPPAEHDEPEHTHSLQERVAYFQRSLPPLSDVFGSSGSYNARTFFPQWQKFLSDRPAEPLSFRKTQASLSQSSITVSRQWDVDSVWLGAKSLAAIRTPNDFRLTFLPRFSLNLSTDQVVQPHGLDLAKTRHVPLGSFQAGSVRFTVFVFFPTSAGTPLSKTSASSNSLSYERLRELYDDIILPAVRETIKDPFRQEVPQSFDMIYAKSRSFQEKPGTDRWSADDESRSFQLAYTLPAKDLPRFWSSVTDKANLLRIQTKRGESVAYFQNPRLLFQSHDLKNTFTRPSLVETLSSFGDVVMAALDPDHLDMRSCWIDIGARYCADGPRGRQRGGTEPSTFLWKTRCNRHLHEKLVDIAPEMPMTATHFRSYSLRDTGNLVSKTTPMRTQNAGHPDCRQPGIIRAKAYNCSKDLFGVMYSSYGLFNSSSLPLLSLRQDMIQDLDSMTKDRERVFTTRRSRDSILRAWEANKRHVRAISDPRAAINYGARKEVTFCLRTILQEWSNGSFDPDQSPHTGPLCRVAPPRPDADAHCPFWIVPSKDINALIFTQAARLVLPLDHIFQEASLSDQPALGNTTESFLRRIFAFYTAQLLCRLLVYNFSSERELNFDKWIWHSTWRVKKQRGVLMERHGLGLEVPIETSGMLWIPRDLVDWGRGHLALATLMKLYIPRSPLQARLTSQKNIQGLATTQLTVEYIIQEWVQEADQAYKERRDKKGNELADRILGLCAEEIARAYSHHLLVKIQSYWDRARGNIGRSAIAALPRLQKAQEDVAAERGHIVTAQTIWEIYKEAWASYSGVVPGEDSDAQMPIDIPCWMATRKYRPPKDGWSEFVYHHLFGRSVKPNWNRIYFLQLYRTFKRFWDPIKASAGRFDDRLKRVVGRFIMVTFNSNQAKEVSTNHTHGTWYYGKPTFFQIQYWAPYFSPPADNSDIRLESKPSEAPRVLLAVQFQDLERAVHQDWLCVMEQTNGLRSAGENTANSRCRRALRRMTLLAGCTWGSGDQLDHIVPWRLGGTDSFRVPLQYHIIAREGPESLLGAPTILLPTRENVMSLFNTIKSFPNLTSGLKQRLKWARRRLDNDGSQYDIRSHLEAKKEAAEVTNQSPSLLRQFLAQTEPPERRIAVGVADGSDSGSELVLSDETESEPDSDSPELSEGFNVIV